MLSSTQLDNSVCVALFFKMIVQNRNCLTHQKASTKVGSGLVNTLINRLPFELHLPGYNYCGPGTKLDKRLNRGDVGINPLDEACKSHDIAYAQNKSLETRHRADLELAVAAGRRWRESNSLPERLLALGVNKIMKYKVKRGMGVNLKNVITAARKAVKKHVSNKNNIPTNNKLISAAIKAARKAIKQNGVAKGQPLKKPRVIPLPKKGGFLPLIPILGALAAAGSLAGGVTTAAKNIYEMVQKKNNNTNNVKDSIPHALGRGMYMAPYKKGMGLYLTPYQKN